MSFRLGTRSKAQLVGVHPDIVRLAERTIEISPVDFCIIPGGGLRTEAQAAENVIRKTGKLLSLHREQSDGFGHAVDMVLYINGRATWDAKYLPQYRILADYTERAGAELMIPFRGGYDWDQDGEWGESGEWDWVHREIPKLQHLARAVALMQAKRSAMGLDAEDKKIPCPCCGCCCRCGDTL